MTSDGVTTKPRARMWDFEMAKAVNAGLISGVVIWALDKVYGLVKENVAIDVPALLTTLLPALMAIGLGLIILALTVFRNGFENRAVGFVLTGVGLFLIGVGFFGPAIIDALMNTGAIV